MFFYPIDEELSLKLIDQGDAEKVFSITDQSRTYLRKWLPWVDMINTVADTREFIRECQKNYLRFDGMNAVVLYKGEIVGVASLNSIDWRSMTTYIGYWLGQNFQGHGIMSRVAKALTDYAFYYHKLHKVEIRVAVGNVKSSAIPERLGYKKERIIPQGEWLYDHYVDLIVYGMKKAAWKQRTAKYKM